MRRVSLLLIVTALATAASASRGGHAGALYRFGLGTQTLGFGGAVVSLAHDPATILVNPAGAAYSRRGSLMGSHTFMALDRAINVLGFARQLDKNAGIGITWVNSGVSNVPGFDQDGNPTGPLDNSENTLAMTFANRFGWVAGGVSAKWYRYRLDTRSSSGWTFDLGLMATPVSGLRLGASVRDLVGSLIWTTNRDVGQLRTEDGFPASLTVGASYDFARLHTLVATDYEKVEGEGDYLHLGVSWEPLDRLRLRGGYRWLGLGAGAHEGTFTAGVSIMAGFGDQRVSFDYAVLNEPLGLVHSLGVKFGM